MDFTQLIKAIQALSNKSLFDYFQIIAPILLSAIAIVITIQSTSRQNRIALFEKRIELLNEVQLIVCFAESVKSMTSPDKGRIVNLYNSVYGMHLKQFDVDSLENMHYRTKKTEMCFSMSDALFGKEYTAALNLLTSSLIDFLEQVLIYQDCAKQMERFVNAAVDFDSTKYKKMCRKASV